MSDLKINKKFITEQTSVSKFSFFHRFFTFKNTLIALITGFFILTIFAKIHPYFYFDLYITINIQKINFPLWGELMYLITLVGNLPWVIVIVSTILMISIILKKIKDSLMILISTTGAIAISHFFKFLINRPRPDNHLINQFDKFAYSDSFPSGHVLFYIGFFGFLFFLTFANLKKTWLRQFLLVILGLMIILIGFSRIYRGAHWFSDVLGAYLIGLVWLLVMIYIYPRIITKN
ncbi:phosphatase PAP2 family protein [Candidatus Daviesbacteria bacterium]|nr:phosphatase PAP2 family protein [Candidatus Daviesbacteria bacterium]